jgi:hypothetical protein
MVTAAAMVEAWAVAEVPEEGSDQVMVWAAGMGEAQGGGLFIPRGNPRTPRLPGLTR